MKYERTDTMKKITALFLAVMILFSLTACSGKKKTALVIAGTEINSEIFTYYLDKVCNSPSDYGLSQNPSDSDLKNAATQECKKYLASNTKFSEGGLSLTASQKVEISQNVNNYWIRFENHYNKIGVSKQTLTKIFTSDTYKDALFSSQYDKGTGDAEAEAVLQDYFYKNYISFRSVCVYFTKPDGNPMTQLEKTQLLSAVDTLAANPGTDVEKFAETVQAAGYSLSDSVLLKKGTSTYPDGFYDKVADQEDNTVQTITYDECVFVVWKENLKEKGESIYHSYRSSCINDLYYDEYETALNEYLAALEVEEKGNVDKIINKLR